MFQENLEELSQVNYVSDVSKAFTLAEVLITLGVIGVVAAITMPILIQKYNNQVVETKLQKTYSLMNQAIKMSEINNGSGEGWFQELTTMEGMKKYILPYLKTIKTDEDDDNIYLYLADGSILSKTKNSIGNWSLYTNDFEQCKNSSERGKCHFLYYYYPAAPLNAYSASVYTKQFEPYDYGWNRTYEALVSTGTYACNKNGVYCTKLIQVNGWKIPKDYPYKVR